MDLAQQVDSEPQMFLVLGEGVNFAGYFLGQLEILFDYQHVEEVETDFFVFAVLFIVILIVFAQDWEVDEGDVVLDDFQLVDHVCVLLIQFVGWQELLPQMERLIVLVHPRHGDALQQVETVYVGLRETLLLLVLLQ